MNTNKNIFKCKRCDKVFYFKQSKYCHQRNCKLAPTMTHVIHIAVVTAVIAPQEKML